MPTLVYRPIEAWPGEPTSSPKPNPFRATWTSTLDLLDRELYALDVDQAVLQVDAAERDFRLDGALRADARLRSDRVILSFEHPKLGPLSYPCDSYAGGYKWVSGAQLGRDRGANRLIPGWQANVRAIALTLEALRAVDRYGAAQTGQQYTGWKAIGAGIAMPPAEEWRSPAEAARYLAEQAILVPEPDGWPVSPWGPEAKGYAVLIHDPAERQRAFRLAAKRLHPDAGGDPAAFRLLTAALDLLDGKTR